MKLPCIIVALLLLAILMPGCKTPAEPPAPALSLTNTAWTLTDLNGAPLAATDGLTTPTLTLDAASKRASGTSGINRFSGAFELQGAQLKFGPLMGTRMAGPPKAMATESAYLAALAKVDAWRIHEAKLELLGSETVLLRFTAEP
jgi:heat shock protein HslJ